ncbi:MAG: 2-oxopent-4-enoate hydratase [Betaproteobacteria bacterium]|nr:2-oxopent-4-enoate hydratase [Betaproteobacteria bacterium]
MRPEDTFAAAALLLQARRSGQGLSGLPEAWTPENTIEAYVVQDAVMREIGPVGGWKVGARGPEAEPNCAPLPRSLIFAQGEALPAALLRLRGVEAEIGFMLGADLPPRAAPYGIDEIAGYIESVHPTLEIVESRYLDFRQVAPFSVLADSNSNGALIVGPAVPAQSREAYGRLGVSLTFDGAEKIAAIGGNPAVDLLRLLTWLANHCAARCGGLRRGEMVTTGSHTGMLFAAPGTQAEATFAALGGVAVSL